VRRRSQSWAQRSLTRTSDTIWEKLGLFCKCVSLLESRKTKEGIEIMISRTLWFIGIASLLIQSSAIAESENTYTVKSKYFDLDPNDGLLDAGTFSNPYEVEVESGNNLFNW
jgi:hypothetical protein